jgi:hypothetical protein
MKLTRQLQVFLLHARSDEETVRRLYTRLVHDGVNAWLDREKLLPGQDWEHEIRNAIYSSDIIIVCLSAAFVQQGGYRHEELRMALEKANVVPDGKIFIIPARLEECEMPESLHRWQRVDLFEAKGYKRLLSVLKKHIAQV